MIYAHDCERCGALCDSASDLCFHCQNRLQRREIEEVSPVIVRQIDTTVARINRRDARAARSRRRRFIAGRLIGFFLVGLVAIGAFFAAIYAVFFVGDCIARGLGWMK